MDIFSNLLSMCPFFHLVSFAIPLTLSIQTTSNYGNCCLYLEFHLWLDLTSSVMDYSLVEDDHSGIRIKYRLTENSFHYLCTLSSGSEGKVWKSSLLCCFINVVKDFFGRLLFHRLITGINYDK